MLRLENFIEDAQKLFADGVENVMTVPAGMMARYAPEDPGSAQERAMQVFEPVLVGVADASDPIFEGFAEPGVVGPSFVKPEGWVKGAKSVVSVFFPFAKNVCISNRHPGVASPEWQYAKFQGTKIIVGFCQMLCEELREAGWEAVMPVASEGFGMSREDSSFAGDPDFQISSAWSERHAAYACGLGTFGLSRGLITRSGMAGRFGSIVTNAPIQPTPRDYIDVHEWCTFCGACVRRCPVGAISLTEGKGNALCEEWLNSIEDGALYGDACGKCQIGVPCSARKPVSLKPKPRPRD